MLIPEAKQAWRFTSVQIMALLAIIGVIEANWAVISPLVPEKYRPWAVSVFAIAAIIARIWVQPVSTAKARDGRMSTLAEEIHELKGQLDVARDPIEHDRIRDELEAKQAELKKLYDIVQITKQPLPTQQA